MISSQNSDYQTMRFITQQVVYLRIYHFHHQSPVQVSPSLKLFLRDLLSLETVHHPLIPSWPRSSPTPFIHRNFCRPLRLTFSGLHSIIVLNGWNGLLESPFQCGIKPPGSISNGVITRSYQVTYIYIYIYIYSELQPSSIIPFPHALPS